MDIWLIIQSTYTSRYAQVKFVYWYRKKCASWAKNFLSSPTINLCYQQEHLCSSYTSSLGICQLGAHTSPSKFTLVKIWLLYVHLLKRKFLWSGLEGGGDEGWEEREGGWEEEEGRTIGMEGKIEKFCKDRKRSVMITQEMCPIRA